MYFFMSIYIYDIVADKMLIKSLFFYFINKLFFQVKRINLIYLGY